MVYTEIAMIAVVFAVIVDLLIMKTRLTRKKVFWTSYSIILPFQLITNWWLTSRNIVMYSPEAILGVRIASAPVEDLMFGFSLVLLVMALWVFWGKQGFQKS
jgi:lycopene cyclase domain-containing protein